MTRAEKILFDNFFKYYRSSFPDNETTERLVGKSIASSEETKPTLEAMKEIAWEAWKASLNGVGDVKFNEHYESRIFESWYNQQMEEPK